MVSLLDALLLCFQTRTFPIGCGFSSEARVLLSNVALSSSLTHKYRIVRLCRCQRPLDVGLSICPTGIRAVVFWAISATLLLVHDDSPH